MSAGLMREIRVPSESDRGQVVDALRVSFNRPRSWVEGRGSTLPIGEFRCAVVDGQVVATAAAFRTRQWFAGRDVPMTGVYGVTTRPEYRASGHGSAVVAQILHEQRADGAAVSALFPAVLRPYRRLGYELAGTYTEHRVPLDAIPEDLGADLPTVDRLDPERDAEGAAACFEAVVRRSNGTMSFPDPDWFRRRMLDPGSDEVAHSVLVRDASGGVEGFLTARNVEAPGHLDVDFGVECSAFVARSGLAARALLAYLRSFRGLGRWAKWPGPTNDPLALIVDEQEISHAFRYSWMERILDVPAAFEARGWPEIDADVTFAVDDPLFEENRGPWRLSVRAGAPAISSVPDTDVRPIPIGALSAMFTGHITATDAAWLGHLDRPDPAIAAFDALLAGTAPWSPVFF
jgi:predicted acetyltransferase